MARGDVVRDGNSLWLADSGRRLSADLIAVADASRLRIEEQLSAQEWMMLHERMLRLAGVSPYDPNQAHRTGTA